MNSIRSDQGAGWLAQFVALGAIWGSSFMFMRLAVADFGPVATATLRVSLGALFLLPLLLWRGQWPALRARWRAIFFVGLLNSGIPFALFAFSLLTITTGLSSIINATVPMFGALVAWLWLGERLGLWRIAGLVLGFVGVTLLAWDQAGLRAAASALHPIWAMLACLGACISYALAASYTRLYLQDVPPLAAATGSQIGAGRIQEWPSSCSKARLRARPPAYPVKAPSLPTTR